MKLFAVYANLELTYKPTWLDDFRAKYDKPYPYHITLIQTRYIDENKIDNLKQTLSSFVFGLQVPNHRMSLAFDHIKVDIPDGSIMIVSSTCGLILEAQKRLITLLEEYNNYYEQESREWENSFQPHITIGRDLTPDMIQRAQSELPTDDFPHGVIKDVTLVVVNKFGPEEANLSENLTHFEL